MLPPTTTGCATNMGCLNRSQIAINIAGRVGFVKLKSLVFKSIGEV